MFIFLGKDGSSFIIQIGIFPLILLKQNFGSLQFCLFSLFTQCFKKSPSSNLQYGLIPKKYDVFTEIQELILLTIKMLDS